MRRVLAVDVLECPRCGGAMKILSAIHPPETTTAILACLGLPTRAGPGACSGRTRNGRRATGVSGAGIRRRAAFARRHRAAPLDPPTYGATGELFASGFDGSVVIGPWGSLRESPCTADPLPPDQVADRLRTRFASAIDRVLCTFAGQGADEKQALATLRG